jgi:hypothetical protein
MMTTGRLFQISLGFESDSSLDFWDSGVEGIRCCEIKSCDTKSPVAPQSTKTVPKIPLILAVNLSNG